MLRVLIACEFSGVVRDAFRRQGVHAVSCDFRPTLVPGPHYRDDVRHLLEGWEPAQFMSEYEDFGQPPLVSDRPSLQTYWGAHRVEFRDFAGVRFVRPVERPYWDAVIAFPPCTYLCSSGMHWTSRGLRDPALTEEAVRFVQDIWECSASVVVVENPVGILSKVLGPALQYVQPYDFGHDASKRTGLWVRGELPPLRPTCRIAPKVLPNGKRVWGNQTASGQSNMPPSRHRAVLRSLTWPGIAEAMAHQWVPVLRALASSVVRGG